MKGSSARLLTWLRAMRVHQWVKNLLVFIPIVLAHRLAVHPLLLLTGTFLALSAIASGTYLVNDLLDRESDRRDPLKRLRPFASGQLSGAQGLAIAAVLIFTGLCGAAAIGASTLTCCAVYLAVTVAYSLFLKRTPILDVAILAFLYTLRLIAGGATSDVYLSPWLYLFSVLLFVSLALVKRYAELNRAPLAGLARGYRPADVRPIRLAGIASGFLAGLVPAFYVNSADALRLYSRPYFLLGVCPLLIYWILRIWRIARRGDMYEDPVLFALCDLVSYAIAGLMMCLALAGAA